MTALPSHPNPHRQGALVMWARRKEVYGPSGCRDTSRMQANGRQLAARYLTKTHCLRGHKLAGTNLDLWRQPSGKVSRKCRACRLIRWGLRAARRRNQPAWDAKWQQLRSAQIAAHPDKGGTPSKFIAATKALKRFERIYQKQYWVPKEALCSVA